MMQHSLNSNEYEMESSQIYVLAKYVWNAL